MAIELPGMQLLDPLHGQQDIENRTIRACSSHFLEDPVRALRAARQSAELGFSISADTFQLMAACRGELSEEPVERILQEMTRALEGGVPSRFFRNLQQASLLKSVFPEIYALIGKTQPKEFHPEGDAFEHTMQLLDTVAKATHTISVRFAALVHDLGKGTTPKEMEPHHYGHEARGLIALEQWNKRCVLPREWLEAAQFVIREHMRAPRLEKPGKIVALLLSLHRQRMRLEDFNQIILADHGSLPWYLVQGKDLLKKISLVSGHDCPVEIQGEDIGKWVFQQQIKVYLNEKV
jgi:tRNA nucleotidyltransferase (CCA-adding enzyme)